MSNFATPPNLQWAFLSTIHMNESFYVYIYVVFYQWEHELRLGKDMKRTLQLIRQTLKI